MATQCVDQREETTNCKRGHVERDEALDREYDSSYSTISSIRYRYTSSLEEVLLNDLAGL